MPAAGALQQRCPHRPRFVVPASRTTKTLRPAELTQILSTGLLGGETRLELGQIPRIIFHFPDPTSCGHLSQVNTRQRQKERVEAGVESGELTKKEAAKLKAQEAKLHREIKKDRKDGGGLTAKERAKISAKQDRLSRRIAKQKHDKQKRKN